MGCVNRNGKEFKALAERNDIAINTLELYTHKYWLETGNETLFPTDVYIQAQIGYSHYQEPGEPVRKLWKLRYNTPQEFTSMNALQAAIREATKYFPKSAIMYHKNGKGNFVLSVKRPVEKFDYSKDDFFEEYDSLGSMKDVKVLDLGLKDHQVYGIDKVQEIYNRFNTDKTSKALADRAFNIARELGLKITFDESLPFGIAGSYTDDNTIMFKRSFLERDMMNNKKAPIVLHEVLHALSVYALSDRTKNWKRPKALEAFRTEMNSLYQDLKSNPMLKGERGIVDLHEFVAELANPVFREKIKNIDRDNKAAQKDEKKSFWSRVIDAFKSLLGLHVTNTYYQRSMNALDKALDAFDIDTYMRYNGIKNTLRQGYNVKEWEFNSMSDEQLKSKVGNYFDGKVYNEELLSLKKKAIENGTFMKAPNGKPTKLSERQWLQVRTQNFKEWFGDWESNPENASKVVDENGEPLVVYHGGAKGIKVFQHSSKEDSTTGYGYYTDKKTGEKIPMDSNRTIFFSSNPFVGTSYATMYGIQQFLKLLAQTENVLYNSNKETGLSFTTEDFKKGLNDFYEFLTNASEINPRFEALKNYLQNLKAIGKKIDKVNEREAILDMLKDLRKKLQDYTSNYLMNRSEWENVYSNAAKVIDEYNNPEGIKRLINGEIPEIILKEWKLYKKIEAQREKEGKSKIDNYKSIHLTLGKGRYYLTYNGKDLKIWDPYYTDPKVSTMTEEELSQFLTDAKNANLLGFKELREDTNYQAVKNKAQEYAVFLNLRNPISHDYEGTHQGEGYKQSQKYPFGYVAARQVNKAFKEGKDGVIYQNIYDPYLADNYGVFNPNQIKSATDNIGEFSTSNPEIYNYELGKEFVDSMSGQQLKNELSTIKQEYADYNLVNGIEEEKKHSGKAVPQDFTFADGTTIKAPFRPNAQQVDALNEMDRFMKSSETTMTLSGYAGTGKTSLMEMIAKKGKMQRRDVVFCASTNKAAAVLNARVSKSDFKATTLHKAFGISVAKDAESGVYNTKNLKTTVKRTEDIEIEPGSTIIIDEASMINEKNYNTLNKIAKAKGLKIIYVGDEAQLAPIGENKISKVFRNGEGKVIRLTQVERTDDNAILKEATNIRNDKPLSGESSFNSKGEGVAYITPSHQDAIDDIIGHYVKGLADNPDYFRILAYTNKSVAAYNDKVRSILGHTTPAPQVGEPMTGYSNLRYDWKTKTYALVNSESYKVVRTEKPKTKKITLDDGATYSMEAFPITLEDPFGKVVTFDYMDIKNNKQNREAAEAIGRKKKDLWVKWHQTANKDLRKVYLAQIHKLEDFLFVNDEIIDEKTVDPNTGQHPTLVDKVIDFGYAMTVHKSQGSTFTNVLIDDIDIARGTREDAMANDISKAMPKVDLGDEGRSATSADTLMSSEEVNLGDLGNAETPLTKTKTSDGVVDTRQQLEYVAVSRATDTVTIISNNVKKEGSPLHPEQSIKEDKAKAKNQPTIPEQLISHLKSQGINVLNRDAMAEFLKIHKLEYLQQYINKHDLPKGELSTLSSALMTKYGNNTAYGDIIQTANYEYIVNYKGAGEYDIIEYHQIDNNIKNDYYDRKNEGFSEYADERAIQDEVTRQKYNSDSYHVENREANGDYAGLDKQTSQGESKQTSSNDGSNQHQEWRAIKRDSATGRIAFVDGDGKTKTTSEDWNKDFKVIPFFMTPQGEVYGFVDKEGNIYLDETKISPEHPIHEYTHLWDRTVQQKNPKLWQRGVELMKQTSLWNEILNDANYGKQWQSMNLPQEKLESLIASEVHSRLVGENGEKLLNNLAKQKGQEGIIGKLKQWILDMWKEVKATFGSWSQEDIDKLSLKDFNHMTVRDLADGVNLKEAPNATYTKENTIDKEEVKTNVEQSSQAEDTTQSVNLPGYQQFKDYFEETPVDAAWKVSYLKELDAQISTENSAEENQNIITQMDNVLQATSEAEYKQEANNTKEKRIQKALDEYEKLTQQINNLLEGDEYLEEMERPLSATEVRHVAELVANHISDLITQMQKEDGAAEKMFPTLTTDLDFQKASRKEILEAVNINRLIEKTKELFDSEHNGMDNYILMDQADVIYDNWEAIMYLAADVFALNEGFGITKDFSNGRFTTTENSKTDYGNFNDYSNDPDYVRENGGKDEQEHWQIESRTIDVLDSMSALVRQGLHECYLLNPDGSKVMSKWGIPERVNPRDTVNSILRWTQGASSLDAMVKMLTNKQQQNPWLSQLIKRLSDTSGNETDFQSQFYNVFSKHFQSYSIVLLEDGKYHSMLVNSHPALKEAMGTITAQFKIGEHPLFTEHSIKASLLGNDNTTGKDADFNFHKAMSEMREITNALYLKKEELDDEKAKTISDNVVAICRAFGYNITEEILEDVINKENISKMTNAFEYLVKKLDNAKDALAKGEIKSYDPFKFKGDNSIGYNLRKFLTPITERLEDTAINAFYDSGKMYQSYVTPSFMTKLMNKFHSEPEEFMKFIEQEYGSSEWFRFKGHGRVKGEWRNEWLRLLAGDRDKQHARKVFDHKVELNFNKHNYMRNMSDAEYTLSLITEYFAESTDAREDKAPSWYRVPMQSNKPSSEFIKFYSYRGEDYKKNIVEGLHKMFLQEVSRIQTVRMRNLDKKDAAFIKNFDSNGRKFCFLPVLNSYLENTDVAKEKRNVLRNADGSISEKNNRCAELLQKLIEGTEALTSEEGKELDDLIDEVITQSTEDRVQSILNKWEKGGILAAAKKIQDIYPKSLDKEKVAAYVRSQVENYLWNDSFASKNILQLTLTDISFYKDAEDLQKRLAQLHAPGNRGRVDAVDYKGNRVSDGKYRTFTLRDFGSFKSNIIANISEVFDKRIREAKTTEQKKQLEALKDSLVRKPGTMGANDKGGKYWNINVTDAQGYSSPSSYRKKALIFGRWSRQAEEIYQKLLSGDSNYADLETAFQPLKPFVYSKLTKNLGVDNAPITSMQVPFQAKNAEYLLIMADALLKGEELSRPNLLRAVFRVMEDSEKFCPTKGIDTVQFESAIKSGLQGAMDIHQFREMEGGEEAAYTFMMNQIFKESYGKDADNNVVRTYKDYNTDTFVHETSYGDYCLQQEVPEHFKNHSQAHGSQIRMITPSDLDFYTTDESGNQVVNFYEWTEPDPNNKGKKIKKRLNAEDFRKEYEKTIARNIEESIADLRAELHLDSGDKREMNIALSKILQREILSSPRYGIDLVQACSVDKKTGEFRIPKGDPVQAKRIEQLINSIIKNRINKQKIAGGPIVQVSNFGTSKQLHIRFNDKQGNLMPLEEEYNPSEHDDMSYKEYCKKHQGGIAYFEVYAPIWSNELVKKFGNPDGTINIEAIEATDPDLLKMVSYRIPTEDKYSCAPMKVVGFMPMRAGDAIMLPYELTEIDDSDFDVDKRYVMRKTYPPLRLRNRNTIEKELFEKVCKSYEKAHKGTVNKKWIGEQVKMFMNNPQKMKNADALMQSLYKEYQSIAYYTSVPTSGKEYRDNKIVDMTYAVLTNQMTADKILNPGGFDAPKKMGYMVAAFKSDTNNLSWDELQSKSIDDLKDLSYTDKDLTFADTQVQFYKQNSAASSLIGVFAVNKVAHATLESNDIWLDVSNPNVCGEAPFNIGGHYVEVKNPDTGEMEKKIEGGITFKGRMKVDMKFDSEGNLIGKTLGSLVSASADAVKDPILNLMNINMTTAGMLNSMLRLGMTFDDAAMFLSQDIIERMLTQFNKENLDNYVSLDEIINKWLDAYRTKYAIVDTSVINSQDLTKEELIEGLTSKEHDAIDYKVLLAFQKLKNITDNMRNLTFSTRFNSISSAVGPLIVDNIILRHKMDKFLEQNTDDGTHFFADEHENIPVDMDDVFADHPILKQFAESVNIAEEVFADMPAGSNSFKTVLKNLPQDIADKIYGDKLLLNDFSEFYQSYLLLQSGVVDEADLKYYVNDFAKEFTVKNYKEKYPDNALIQDIRMNVNKKTGRPFLTLNITGMDEQKKERYRSAWVDLHKADPELSKQLFEYSFFRAGIGFSPKTLMSLVPTFVKERIKSKDGSASYIDTYRNFPDVEPKFVRDQFIRNNWDNNKLVPKRSAKGTHYDVDLKKGTLRVFMPNEVADTNGLSYMKINMHEKTYLWRLNEEKSNSKEVIFDLVKPLGNNGEYLEMSLTDNKGSLTDTIQTAKEIAATSLKTDSPAESDSSNTSNNQVTTTTQTTKKLDNFVDFLMKKNPEFGKQAAFDMTTKSMRGKESIYGSFIQLVYEKGGLHYDKKEAISKYKEMMEEYENLC